MLTTRMIRRPLAAALVALASIPSSAFAQPPPSEHDRIELLAGQVQDLQREVNDLRQRDADRPDRDAAAVVPLPPVDQADAESATLGAADKKPEEKPLDTLSPLSGDCGKITFRPGVRLQPRYIYDSENHDFVIQRFRLKAKGDIMDYGHYSAEVKTDKNGLFGTESGKAEVENAWINFTPMPDLDLRAGLYDLPFSRNALTSDSKLLLMDRSLIKDALTSLGLADNTIGLLANARPFGGRIECSAGIFDNIQFDKFAQESDQLMPAGRISLHLLDPADGYADYRESYIGDGQRLSIGANTAYLDDASVGADEFDLHAWGVDLFFNRGPYVFQAEYDRFGKDRIGAIPDLTGDGWYVQGGYLLNYCQHLACPCSPAWELALRYQELDADDFVFSDRLQWTSFGINLYLREHNLKVQTDYTFKREQANQFDNDTFQMQLQLDF